MNWFARYVVAPVTIGATLLASYGCRHKQDYDPAKACFSFPSAERYGDETRKMLLNNRSDGGTWHEYQTDDGKWLYFYLPEESSQACTEEFQRLEAMKTKQDSTRRADSLRNARSDDGWYPGYRPPGYDHVDPPPASPPR